MHGFALPLAPVLTLAVPLLGAVGLVMVAPVLWLPALGLMAVLGVGLLALRHPCLAGHRSWCVLSSVQMG